MIFVWVRRGAWVPACAGMSVDTWYALRHATCLANPSELRPQGVPVGRGARWEMKFAWAHRGTWVPACAGMSADTWHALRHAMCLANPSEPRPQGVPVGQGARWEMRFAGAHDKTWVPAFAGTAMKFALAHRATWVPAFAGTAMKSALANFILVFWACGKKRGRTTSWARFARPSLQYPLSTESR